MALGKVGKLFIIALAALIIVWLLLDKVQCNPPSLGEEKESVIKALDSAEKVWFIKEDSLKKLATAGSQKLDSLRKQKTTADKDLKVYMDRSSSLAREIIRIRSSGGPIVDNSVMVEKCDSLANEVEGLHYRIGHYKWIVDSMTNQQDALVNIERERVNEAIEFNRQMRQAVDSVSLLYDHLNGLYKKAVRKLDKKYTLSLSAGYGIGTEGTPQPFVGITFGRTLIRF